MPKYAYYNGSANPSPILGWYDTDPGEFPNLPSQENLLTLTDTQWVARNDQVYQVLNGQLVVIPPVPLADVQRAKLFELSAACQGAIFAGFVSSALGAAHTYPAKDRDQSNLAGSVLASVLPGVTTGWTTPFWCADSSGNWSFVAHTAAQIQQVGSDAKAAIVTALGRNAQLGAQVMAATTVTQVQAIVW
jgi:hypothetical protein